MNSRYGRVAAWRVAFVFTSAVETFPLRSTASRHRKASRHRRDAFSARAPHLARRTVCPETPETAAMLSQSPPSEERRATQNLLSAGNPPCKLLKLVQYLARRVDPDGFFQLVQDAVLGSIPLPAVQDAAVLLLARLAHRRGCVAQRAAGR